MEPSRGLDLLPVLVLSALLLLAAGVAPAQVDAVVAGQPTRVCLNDGAGAFSCSEVPGEDALAVALADVDGTDGPDAVFARVGLTNRVCLNDGPGSFSCSDVSAETHPTFAVALADVDGAGGPDAVFANRGEANRVCWNDGTGTGFMCFPISFEFNDTFGVAAADLDGVDGPDVVFANGGQRNRVCLNHGDGTFSCSDVSTDANDSQGVALGDVDGVDGLDAVFATGNDRDRVCLNDGTGGFTCSAVSADFRAHTGVALGDVDGADGPDAVFASLTAEDRVCLNDGAGGFTCSDLVDGIVDERLGIEGSGTSLDVALGILVPADLSVTKTDGQPTAVPGESVTYTITATNAGPYSALGAVVSDPFPAALSCSWICTGSGGAVCTPGPVFGDLDDTVELPDGSSVTYTAVCAVDSAATGTLVNTATISAPAGVTDPSLGDNSASDSDILTPVADVAITKDDGQATAVPGETTVYTIVAGNPAGPSDAPGTAVKDHFSPLLDCTWSCAPSGGASCSPGSFAGAGDIADLADLPVGGAATYTAVCGIDPGATGTISNIATVTAAAGITDPVSGNDSATDVDTMTPEADLAITKDDGVTIALPGDVLSYTIVASNPGPSDAPATAVEDLFPPELTACEWTCTPAGGASCTGGPVAGDLVDSADLLAGSSATYTAVCTVDPEASFEVLSNTATVTAPAGVTDPDLADNAATDVDFGDQVVVFTDGFESGDTTAWSQTTP